jgi:hypothetical protein
LSHAGTRSGSVSAVAAAPSGRGKAFIPDDDDPYQIVSKLMGAVPPGSFLVIVHGASDIRADTAVAEGTRRYNEASSQALSFRSREEVMKFFDGLEILDTGSGHGQVSGAGGGQLSYFGIGRKPSLRRY